MAAEVARLAPASSAKYNEDLSNNRLSVSMENTDPLYIIQFQSDCLRRHNELRRFHGCQPLKLSESLSARAQSWAEHLTDADKYAHSSLADRKRTGAGENLAFRWYTNGKKRPKGDEIADIWYNEVKDYSWEVPELNLTRFAGHFTQLIWAGTSQVGFGIAADGRGKITVVAQYQTAGNVKGDYELNVPPRIDGLPIAWPESGAATTVPKGRRSLLISDSQFVVDVDTMCSSEENESGEHGSVKVENEVILEEDESAELAKIDDEKTSSGNSSIDVDDVELKCVIKTEFRRRNSESEF